MAAAKIPRIASNVANEDWGDQNAYPLDAGSTGVVTLLPEALIQQDINKIGVIRVDLAAASALTGIMKQIYGDDAEFLYDAPVPAGTTDYGQFLLAADRKGTDGVVLALGEQEAVQIATAGQQLGNEQVLGSALGTFSYDTVKELGDYAKQMVFLWSYPPATADLPVYKALRADLAASGDDGLQPENVRSSAMRSWIALYGLLRMIRDEKMTTFTRAGITELLQNAKDVPMLGMYGDESWTPDKNHDGIFQRAGMNHWGIYRWDPDATSAGFDGNFVETGELNFDEVLCGSVLGAPPPC
jgi:ABC-type branched-subunit amino acid transport system substrate-binding protein